MDMSTHIAHLASWTSSMTAIRFEGRAINYADLEPTVAAAAAWLPDQTSSAGFIGFG